MCEVVAGCDAEMSERAVAVVVVVWMARCLRPSSVVMG